VEHARLTGHRPVATADDLSGIEVPVATAPAGVQSGGTRSSDRPQAGWLQRTTAYSSCSPDFQARARLTGHPAFAKAFRLRWLRRDLPSSDYGTAGKSAWQAGGWLQAMSLAVATVLCAVLSPLSMPLFRPATGRWLQQAL